MSTFRVDEITNRAGDGAPHFPNGLTGFSPEIQGIDINPSPVSASNTTTPVGFSDLDDVNSLYIILTATLSTTVAQNQAARLRLSSDNGNTWGEWRSIHSIGASTSITNFNSKFFLDLETGNYMGDVNGSIDVPSTRANAIQVSMLVARSGNSVTLRIASLAGRM